MTSRILVATDLSDAAAEAVRQGHVIARDTRGVLGVCHVIPNLQGVHMFFPQDYATEALDRDGLEKLAGDALSNAVTSLTGRVDGEFELVLAEGTDATEIVKSAESWGATLLVVGGHGRSGLASVLLGSVAERAVRYAPCPVLIARAPATTARVVLVATDLSDPSLPAVERAVAEARRRGAKLVAVNAVDLGAPLGAWMAPFGAPPVLPSADALRDLCDAARTTLTAAVARFGGEGEVFVEAGHAVDVIQRAIATHHPELLVLATHGRTGLARVALGSVAEKLVRTAETSVLVVR